MSFSLQSAQSLLRDVRHPALAFRIGSTCEALRGDDAAEKIARAVTLRAMAQAVDEIGAAIPPRRSRRVRPEGPVVHEQQFPDPDIAPDVERKRHVMIAHFAGNRRQRLQIGKEVADVFDPGMRRRTYRETPESNAARRARPLASPRGRTGPRSIARCHRPDRARCWERRTSRTATGKASPPPSRVRSGWPGTAWQEEHPPALKVVWPFGEIWRVRRPR